MTDKRHSDWTEVYKQQSIWAEGSAIFTCGATTGDFVKAVAFCDCDETASALADAFTALAKLGQAS